MFTYCTHMSSTDHPSIVKIVRNHDLKKADQYVYPLTVRSCQEEYWCYATIDSKMARKIWDQSWNDVIGVNIQEKGGKIKMTVSLCTWTETSMSYNAVIYIVSCDDWLATASSTMPVTNNVRFSWVLLYVNQKWCCCISISCESDLDFWATATSPHKCLRGQHNNTNKVCLTQLWFLASWNTSALSLSD